MPSDHLLLHHCVGRREEGCRKACRAAWESRLSSLLFLLFLFTSSLCPSHILLQRASAPFTEEGMAERQRSPLPPPSDGLHAVGWSRRVGCPPRCPLLPAFPGYFSLPVAGDTYAFPFMPPAARFSLLSGALAQAPCGEGAEAPRCRHAPAARARRGLRGVFLPAARRPSTARRFARGAMFLSKECARYSIRQLLIEHMSVSCRYAIARE